jgi:hypothetical protein
MKKRFIVLLTFLCLFSDILAQSKIDKFEKAYDYICHDTDYINNSFTKVVHINSNNFCVSTEIIQFGKILFIRDIIADEYKILSKEKQSELEDSLREIENSKTYKTYIYKKLDKLNVTDTYSCHLKIYFSDIVDNQFTAELVLNRGQNLKYKEEMDMSVVSVAYYFIMDDDNQIIKKYRTTLLY